MELLIVVVVIAILAAVTVVAYNGVQARTRDSRRVTDARAITKALAMYATLNNSFPSVATTGAGPNGGWETSSNELSGEFIKPLATAEYGLASGVLIDPINDTASGYFYRYYVYGAGTYGCPAARGNYYVLAIYKTETYGTAKHPDSPGFSCSSRDWQPETSWVTGGFVQ